MADENLSYSPGLEGVVAGETGVSHVDPAGLSLIIRGFDVKDLVENSNYEEVAFIVLYKVLPKKQEFEDFINKLKNRRQISRNLKKMVKHLNKRHEANQMDVLRTAVSYLGAEESKMYGNAYESNFEKAISLIAKLPTIVAYSYRYSQGKRPIKPRMEYSHAENFLHMLGKKKLIDLEVKIFDKSLMLYVDHDFNASTFTDRVVASARSDIYSSVTAGVGALKGPRHGGANEEAAKMLLEIGNKERAVDYVRGKLERKEKLPGFGHREYKIQDPRAIIMKEMFKQLSEQRGDMSFYELANEVENVFNKDMEEKGKYLPANVDYPCGGLYHMLGVPLGIYTPIFALSRVTGWCAHYIEEITPVQKDGNTIDNPIIRPKALYSGPSGLEYVPMDKRE